MFNGRSLLYGSVASPFRQVATLMHDHMARHSPSLLYPGHEGYVNIADYVMIIIPMKYHGPHLYYRDHT